MIYYYNYTVAIVRGVVSRTDTFDLLFLELNVFAQSLDLSAVLQRTNGLRLRTGYIGFEAPFSMKAATATDFSGRSRSARATKNPTIWYGFLGRT
jgi:hypothetical protein